MKLEAAELCGEDLGEGTWVQILTPACGGLTRGVPSNLSARSPSWQMGISLIMSISMPWNPSDAVLCSLHTTSCILYNTLILETRISAPPLR